MQLRKVQLNRVEVVSLCHKQILEAIVVIVQEVNAPAGMKQRQSGQAAGVSVIGKGAVAIVLVKRVLLVRKIGDYEIWKPVIVVILQIDPHARIRSAVGIHCDLCQKAHLFKRSVSFVAIKELGHRIVSDGEIYLSVTIDVADSDPESFAGLGQA